MILITIKTSQSTTSRSSCDRNLIRYTFNSTHVAPTLTPHTTVSPVSFEDVGCRDSASSTTVHLYRPTANNRVGTYNTVHSYARTNPIRVNRPPDRSAYIGCPNASCIDSSSSMAMIAIVVVNVILYMHYIPMEGG